MQFQLPTPEVKGKASSGYTPELIDARIAKLRERHDAEALREIEYLEGVRAKAVAKGAG